MSELYHFGTAHVGSIPHSGRYEWGSGDEPFQRGEKETIAQFARRMKRNGKTEVEIARQLDISTTKLRNEISREANEELAANIHRATTMKEHGYSVGSIASEMGVPERTVYNWLNPKSSNRLDKKAALTNSLKVIVDEKGYVDVGPGTEYMLNTNSSALKRSLSDLEADGYSVHTVKTKNTTDPNKFTNIKVLCKPGTTWGYIQNHQELIQPFTEFSTDGGASIMKTQYPTSISSDRVAIRYAEDGGKDYDGVMYIRRNVADLSLGNSNYAQVRIAVDGTHYLKGMAMYSDDIPDGVDILFNTNKTKDVPKMKVLKSLKDNEDLPFGAVIAANGQSFYENPDGDYIKQGSKYVKVTSKTSSDESRYSLSAINKLKEEGDWDGYSKTLSSQMLSKQSLALIKKQLNLSYAEKLEEFEEIKSLTQPEIKKRLLLEFASDCDSSAVDLKATALPGQTTKVILPLTCIKDNQIYAPGYSNGSQVALIRYPHAGLFEIPILTVNNNNRDAKKILGNAPIDAVGITSATASKLSGADFDGDTVVVIPLSDKVKIANQPTLEYKDSSGTLRKLSEFDPSSAYPGYSGMHVMTDQEKGLEMGKISNLISDMTLQGAPASDVARAVKHSMVVIDAKKHELNYKLSYQENGIAALSKEYQGKATGGAATLISRASGIKYVNERKQFNAGTDIDPETGEIVYRETGRTYKKPIYETEKDPVTGKKVTVYTKNQYGKTVPIQAKDSEGNLIFTKEKVATMESTKMGEAKDAFILSSGTPKETEYAKYANNLKALANKARLEYLDIPNSTVNKSAKDTYAKEIESLDNKLENAIMNSPKERAAQLISSQKIKNMTKTTDMTKDELKKARQQALASARAETGANKKDVQIDISDSEWEAILNGALSSSKINAILNNCDSEKIKQLATPKTSKELSNTKIQLIKARVASGFTISEIADSLGISASTVSKYIKD